MTVTLRLGDVVTIERGTTYKSALIGLDGPVLLGLGSIQRNGGFRSDALRTYGGDSPDRLLVRPGQIYASLKDVTQSADLLGAVALLPEDGPVGRLTQDTVRLDIQDSAVPTDYLYWILRTPQYRHYCRSHLTGTTNLGLPREDFLAFEFPAPTPDLLALTSALGLLNDKIESNWRQADLVLALADALYGSACSGDSGELRVGDVAVFHNRRRIPLSSRERAGRVGPYPYYGATGVFGYVDDFLFDEVLALVGEDGSVVNADGTPVTQYIWGPSWINNHAHPLTGSGISTELLFTALRAVDVRPIVTGAVQAKVSMGNLKKLTVQIPQGSCLSMLEPALKPLFALYRQVTEESRVLIELRDALLPELLSGRIRVPEAEEAVAS